jgi:hypothetical protein
MVERLGEQIMTGDGGLGGPDHIREMVGDRSGQPQDITPPTNIVSGWKR